MFQPLRLSTTSLSVQQQICGKSYLIKLATQTLIHTWKYSVRVLKGVFGHAQTWFVFLRHPQVLIKVHLSQHVYVFVLCIWKWMSCTKHCQKANYFGFWQNAVAIIQRQQLMSGLHNISITLVQFTSHSFLKPSWYSTAQTKPRYILYNNILNK